MGQHRSRFTREARHVAAARAFVINACACQRTYQRRAAKACNIFRPAALLARHEFCLHHAPVLKRRNKRATPMKIISPPENRRHRRRQRKPARNFGPIDAIAEQRRLVRRIAARSQGMTRKKLSSAGAVNSKSRQQASAGEMRRQSISKPEVTPGNFTPIERIASCRQFQSAPSEEVIM